MAAAKKKASVKKKPVAKVPKYRVTRGYIIEVDWVESNVPKTAGTSQLKWRVKFKKVGDDLTIWASHWKGYPNYEKGWRDLCSSVSLDYKEFKSLLELTSKVGIDLYDSGGNKVITFTPGLITKVIGKNEGEYGEAYSVGATKEDKNYIFTVYLDDTEEYSDIKFPMSYIDGAIKELDKES